MIKKYIKEAVREILLGEEVTVDNSQALNNPGGWIGKRCLIRSHNAGVFVGDIKVLNGNTVTLDNCRRIWNWSGAASLSQLAKDGVKNSSESKISVPSNNHGIFQVIEILPMHQKAIDNIDNVPHWSV